MQAEVASSTPQRERAAWTDPARLAGAQIPMWRHRCRRIYRWSDVADHAAHPLQHVPSRVRLASAPCPRRASPPRRPARRHVEREAYPQAYTTDDGPRWSRNFGRVILFPRVPTIDRRHSPPAWSAERVGVDALTVGAGAGGETRQLTLRESHEAAGRFCTWKTKAGGLCRQPSK